MNILLVRHGETPWNREGRYQGHTDIPLSEIGETQATALGRRLADQPITRAVASPLQRAQRTAQLALDSRASLLTTDRDLIEIAHGDWEGKLTTEIEASHPELLLQWRTRPTGNLPAGPNAETLDQVTTRAWNALARATTGLANDDTLLIVAHDAVNRCLLCKILGLPLTRVWAFQQAPATVNALTGPTIDELQLVRLNDASHHASLFSAATHKAL